jgi:AcrR family transcriptional regulator
MTRHRSYSVKLLPVTRTADSPPRARPRRPLSRARIVEAAIALVEREGPAALSMRRLGSRLGVEGMALYHHVVSREELLRAIADRLLEPLGEFEPTDDWRDACGRFAGALRRIANARPATFVLVGLQPLDTPALLAPVEALLATLVACGFPASDALAVYRAVSSYARGYALAEATGFTVDAAHAEGVERLRALDPGSFPILAGRSQELACLDADSAFELGLRALLDGLPNPSRA